MLKRCGRFTLRRWAVFQFDVATLLDLCSSSLSSLLKDVRDETTIAEWVAGETVARSSACAPAHPGASEDRDPSCATQQLRKLTLTSP